MELDYLQKGKVKIGTIRYVHTILMEVLEKLGAAAVTPAAEHLFQVRNESEAEYLYQEKTYVKRDMLGIVGDVWIRLDIFRIAILESLRLP